MDQPRLINVAVAARPVEIVAGLADAVGDDASARTVLGALVVGHADSHSGISFRAISASFNRMRDMAETVRLSFAAKRMIAASSGSSICVTSLFFMLAPFCKNLLDAHNTAQHYAKRKMHKPKRTASGKGTTNEH